MVRIYVDLIKKGLKTLADVPEKLRADVRSQLVAEGIIKPAGAVMTNDERPLVEELEFSED